MWTPHCSSLPPPNTQTAQANLELREACRSDAKGCYAYASERMLKAHLTEGQRKVLALKLDDLKQSLRRLQDAALFNQKRGGLKRSANRLSNASDRQTSNL
jgi:hypothetical protein